MFASVGEHFSKNSKFWNFCPILALTKFCLLDYRFIPTVQWEKKFKIWKNIFSKCVKKFSKIFKKCQESFSWPTHKKSGSLSGGGKGPSPPCSRRKVNFGTFYLRRIMIWGGNFVFLSSIWNLSNMYSGTENTF